MGIVTVDNYDGDKGYIGDERFDAVELDGRTYLFPGDLPIKTQLDDSSVGHDMYVVIQDHINKDQASAEKIDIRKDPDLTRRALEKLLHEETEAARGLMESMD